MKLVIPSMDLENRGLLLGDLLGKKPFAESLTNLINNNDSELVISLNGEWGVGKTTFIKMWQAMLDKEDIPNVYIDAFESDYVDDPFMSIVSSIYTFIPEEAGSTEPDKSVRQVYKEKATKIGKNFLSMLFDKGVSGLTAGVVSGSEVVSAVTTTSTEQPSKGIMDQKFDAHLEHARIIKDFKDYLTKLPDTIINADSQDRSGLPLPAKPLIIIIDELDRCRPPFALEMLEKIKHIFSTPNIVFVLVMNRNQIEQSIRYIYGHDIKADTYLQKFIHFDFNFPVDNGGVTIDHSDVERYSKDLLKRHEIDDDLQRIAPDYFTIENCEHGIIALSNFFNLSLRQVEKITSNFVLLLSQCLDKSFFVPDLFWFISFLKVYDSRLFEEMMLSKITMQDVFVKLELLKREDYSHSTVEDCGLQYIMSWVSFSYVKNKEEYDSIIPDTFSGDYDDYRNSLSMYNIAPNRLFYYIANKLNLVNASAH